MVVPFKPILEVILRRQVVPLMTVATRVGQHEVVSQVRWVARPGYEVIHFHATFEIVVAVEASPGLDIPENPAKWVAHCKPVGKGKKAIEYLSRYLYRGVLSDRQLIHDDGTRVTFRYKDSQSNSTKTRTLPGEKLIRLLLLHVLPRGFRRARDYGFLHGNAKRQLRLLQYLLRIVIPPAQPRPKAEIICPCCQAVARITAFIRPHERVPLQPG